MCIPSIFLLHEYKNIADFEQKYGFSLPSDIKKLLAESLLRAGAASAKNGYFGSAIKNYTQAIELYPNFAEAYSKRSLAHANKGEHEKARQDREKANELNRNRRR